MCAGAVCCVFLLALAVGNDPVRASGANRGLPSDDKVAIVLKPSELLFGSCPKLPPQKMNVRFQALKTKSGAIFRRRVVTDDLFACLAANGSQGLAASSIQECSEQTKAAGLEMFRWNEGQCTGYTNGIPRNFTRCAGAGSVVVLYSGDVEAISPVLVVRNITLALRGNIVIDAAWDVTPNYCFASYRVSFNNHDTFTSDKLATVGLDTAPPCAEYPLTVTPVSPNTAVIGPAVTVKVVIPKAIELSLNLTHGVTAVKASWGAVYTCNPSKPPIKGVPITSYSVQLGNQTGTTDNSTFEFTFNKESNLCSDTASNLTADLNEVTVTALDSNGVQLGNVTVSLTDTNMSGHRYVPSGSRNCIYYQDLNETSGGVGFTYDQVKNFCQNTMLSDPFDGAQKQDYIKDLLSLRNQTVIVAPHYVGVKRNSTSAMWVWLTGAELPVPDPWWGDTSEPTGDGDCAELNASWILAAASCNATKVIVCYDYLDI